MQTKIVLILGLTALMSAPTSTSAQHHHGQPPMQNEALPTLENCSDAFLKAAEDYFLKTRSPLKIELFSVKASNDEILEKNETEGVVSYECMRNAVFQIELPTHGYIYAVIHIHFKPTGEWISTKGSMETEWEFAKDPNEWKPAWCAFLKNSFDYYKKDLAEQGCEP